MPGHETVDLDLEPSWFEGGGNKLRLTVEFCRFVEAMERVLCPRLSKPSGFTINIQAAELKSALAARLAHELVVMVPDLFRTALNVHDEAEQRRLEEEADEYERRTAIASGGHHGVE
jgi:hypothetical protein